MIEVIAYKHVNGVKFDESEEADLIAVFGEPQERRVNREGALELHYASYIARLDAKSKRFREFTLLPECDATVNGIRVEWQPQFLSIIEREDPALVDVLGFIVSLKMGLAFTGFHDDDLAQRAVHAFRKGDWDVFQPRMRPFHFTS